STLQVFESNFHGIGDDGLYPLVKDGDNLINIEIIDGTVVFELIEDMLSEDVVVWDFFGVPEEGDNVDFRIVGEDGPFETVAEAIAAGGTCEDLASCGAVFKPAIAVDSNDVPVYEPTDPDAPPTVGPTEGQLLVSLTWQPGEPSYPAFNATVVVDPNVDGDGPHADFVFPDSDPCLVTDGSVTLSFSDANWSIPQLVVVQAVEDLDREGNESYPIELTVTINIADPNFGNPTPVVVESSVDVIDNDIPFVLATPDEFEISESDPCTCVDLTVRLSHKPTDNVYVRVLSEGWIFGGDDKAEMAYLDPPLGPDVPDPNLLTFTTVDDQDPCEATLTSGWNVEQTITVCPIDNDELAEAWTEWIEGVIFLPSYSEDVRYLVPWFNSDGSGADNPETEEEEEMSDGEAEETIVAVSVQDNECGAVGYDPMDFNEDCRVGLGDFAHFYAQWQFCTEPYDNSEVYPAVPSECDKLWDLVGGGMGG
ncbi:MAG: hypothetical protein ACYSUX_18875, partial [Planctomycetota bacterium]